MGCLLVASGRSDASPGRPSDGWTPDHGYLVNVRADLLSHLASRVVIPLLPEGGTPMAISELNPVFEIEGKRHVLVTQAVASIPSRELSRTIASLSDHHDAITRALDIFLLGF